ncbi:MAG: RdgB/HAM1 family non-canonical purine NTP pyrophosphatase [Vicinamibacterales bacterium]|jgi:XTP/dITP diphosphohydrolase|nr:RdgB/HAM1 family non-canonical purine NTP pyrophosphatase [Vicinamibacterales bacterium]HJO18656.1 RdgB/HAM1 family non-canonical purine NTP pyrophosphatase [Vicinamibacterales bacterium]|tara:strand:+ start:5445 stop:6044 length:600 start_codon:yes stop_codon:yes gene_type:complete
MQLLVATTNAHKLSEIRSILTGLDVDLVSLSDFPPVIVPDETGDTFVANAREKALHYAAATGQLTLAEDSGLEIDGLNGEPGVHSARFNGDSYSERFKAIYTRLANAERLRCRARFVCALVVVRGSNILFETRGIVEGQVADEPSGAAGFGYDPIFHYPPYGKTLAEVSREEKAAVSHRGKAVRALRNYLATNTALWET